MIYYSEEMCLRRCGIAAAGSWLRFEIDMDIED